ncbi:MAG: CHAT domain-containing protein [Candidatus Aminicenantes bacterium]|nr:CHAT domain-containing protein [Candidatus Aminicenantes bacterium]
MFQNAENLKQAGKFQEALPVYEQALTLAKKLKNQENICLSLQRLGLMHLNLGNLEISSDYYLQSFKAAQKAGLEHYASESGTALKIQNLLSEGIQARTGGAYQESLKHLERALVLSQKVKYTEHELKCLRHLSLTHWRLNNISEFYRFSEKALRIAKNLNHRQEESRCSINIGVFYRRSDNYSGALNYYERALHLARELGNKTDESACLNNIGIIYENIGNYDKSLDYLHMALKIDRELGNELYIAMDLNNLGETYRSRGLLNENKEDLHKALENFKQVLKIINKKKDTKTEISVLNNLGIVHSDLENYSEALSFFDIAYEKAQKESDIEAIGMILNNMGIAYSNLGDYEESTRKYEKAINIALEIRGGKILWEAYLEIGKAYELQGEIEKARENYQNSISIIEDIRSRIKLEELKASYLGSYKRIDAYHRLIHLLVREGQNSNNKKLWEEAFNYLERARARAFLDSLEISQVNISQGLSLKLKNEEKALMSDISKLYTKLLETEISPEARQTIHNQIEEKEQELEALKREIRTQSPAYANLKYPDIITLNEARRLLKKSSTAVFEYSIAEKNSYLFVLTRKKLDIFPLPTKENLHRLVSKHLRVITDKENLDFSSSHELFKVLIQPGLTNRIQNLIIVPDDILHFLPFETLCTHAKSESWLIKDSNISYVPSMSSLREITLRKKNRRFSPQYNFLAFGDPNSGKDDLNSISSNLLQNFFSNGSFDFSPLRYSELEVTRIGSLFKKEKKTIFLREESSEETLKQYDLSAFKIIHFATHSIIDEKQPIRSSIVLFLDNDPTEDGLLQTREIFNLKLNADLVTLSSCQTGLGQYITGEGIEGLNRAFFFSGANSVLMSLWSVHDQASYHLMERFYHHLKNNLPIYSALRQAKLEMIDSQTFSHPYYWAGFIISGKADEIVFAKSKTLWIVLLIIVILVFVVSYIVYKRLKKR